MPGVVGMGLLIDLAIEERVMRNVTAIADMIYTLTSCVSKLPKIMAGVQMTAKSVKVRRL